jgi:hypothetical protein
MLGLNNLAWLGLLVWIGVPLFAFLMGALLWRQSRTALYKGLVLIASAVFLSGPMLVSMGVKGWYDQQVRELCAKDGGVKVYETVRLPAEKFDQWGQPNFNIPVTPYNKLKDADQYYLEWEITNLKLGNPKLERSHFRLIRHSDNKLLGESASYSRSGGDLPGPWHGSSFICPEPTKHQSLESSIFIKGDKQ